MENHLTLCVLYTAKPGQREAFLREVRASGVLDKIRAEEGCLAYRYFCSADQPDQLLLLEKWSAEAQQKAHLAQPHMEVIKALKDRYILDTSVERFS